MAGILEQLIKSLSTEQAARVLPPEQRKASDPGAASGAVLSALIRGLAQKAQTADGASSLWDMLNKHAQQGNLPTNAPPQGKGPAVRDLDPKVTEEILKNIFGNDAEKVQGRLGKVVMLDPETTKKLMGAILPSVLGGLFGQAKESPGASPQSLPDILGKARVELDQRQPKSGGAFDAILDRDHDGDVDLSDLLSMLKEGDSNAPPSKAPPASRTTDF